MNSQHMDALEAKIRLGIEDAKRDNPDVGEHDIVHEIVLNMTIGHSVSVRNEMWGRFGL